MKPKLTITIIVFLLSAGVYAQKDTVKYTVLEDNPYDIAKLNLEFSPIYARFDMANSFAIGLEAAITANLFDRVELRGNFTKNYPGVGKSWFSEDDTYFPLYYGHLEKIDYDLDYKWFEIGVGIKISDQVRDQKHYMNVHSQQTGNVIIHNVVSIESKFRKIRKIRGGIINYNSQEPLNNTLLSSDDETTYYTDDGVEISSESVYYPDIDYLNLLTYISDNPEYNSYNDREYSGINSEIFIPTSSTLFYIGYSSERIMNTYIDIEGHGKRYKRFRTEAFIDFIFGTPDYGSFEFYKSDPAAIEYGKEVSNTTKEYEIDFDASDLSFTKYGFRVGYIFRTPARSKTVKWENKGETDTRLFYGSLKMTAGMLPSFRSANTFFFDITYSLAINAM